MHQSEIRKISGRNVLLNRISLILKFGGISDLGTNCLTFGLFSYLTCYYDILTGHPHDEIDKKFHLLMAKFDIITISQQFHHKL